MAGRISNERDLIPFLSRIATWRLLFGCEVGAVSTARAAAELGLDPNEFDWLRAVALARLRERTGG